MGELGLAIPVLEETQNKTDNIRLGIEHYITYQKKTVYLTLGRITQNCLAGDVLHPLYISIYLVS